MSVQIIQGDCIEEMRRLPAQSVDACVTDPPYELGFMGKQWDASGIAYSVPMWSEVFRLLKPGAHLVSFGGTRTYHRMTCAIEDAGFEVRDQLAWVFGQGFPKSHNLRGGLGTALKPAWEPICLARKPLDETVAKNAARWGTGVLDIAGCRVGGEAGRWPANLCHDGSEEVLACFPDAPGQLADAKVDPGDRKTRGIYGAMKRGHEPSGNSENVGEVGFKMRPGARRLDSGNAARFFYCAKATKTDREDGCDDLPARLIGMSSAAAAAAARGESYNNGDGGVNQTKERRNTHLTVKPTELMRWLCRLVTPAGGVVLDPFMGSGSTGRAAAFEGVCFIGIEREASYVEIARARIAAVQPKGWLLV